MEAKEEIIQLKVQRSKLTTRITSLSKQLSTNSNSSDLKLFKQLYRQINKAYSEFNDTHTSYCELVEADDKYEEYRVVSSLDLNAYYDIVKQTYDEAVTAFNGVKLQSVEYDIHRIVKGILTKNIINFSQNVV